jgi:hypothetical protein
LYEPCIRLNCTRSPLTSYDFQAGAIAAFAVDLLVYPLDTLKTRFQAPEYAKLYTNASTGKANPALFRGLYQGIGSVIIATLPSCESVRPLSRPFSRESAI